MPPHAQAMVTVSGQGWQAPEWHAAAQTWFPQRSRRPQGWSQAAHALPSQQRRLHWCRPHARIAWHRLSHLPIPKFLSLEAIR